jgi:hypothetical protein
LFRRFCMNSIRSISSRSPNATPRLRPIYKPSTTGGVGWVGAGSRPPTAKANKRAGGNAPPVLICGRVIPHQRHGPDANHRAIACC